MLLHDRSALQDAVRQWVRPRSLSPAQQEEWAWLVHSRVLRPGTADILQAAQDEEWWVLPEELQGVLQLRRRGTVPKIHGLVVRTPGCGDGRRLVQAVLDAYGTVWVGAHPTAVGFYAKLGFVCTPDFPSTPSEVAMIRTQSGRGSSVTDASGTTPSRDGRVRHCASAAGAGPPCPAAAAAGADAAPG